METSKQAKETLQKFVDKETQLHKAFLRVNKKLLYFAKNQNTLPESVLKDWNNLHDLSDRIQDRINENISNYKRWHWEQYGFNTY